MACDAAPAARRRPADPTAGSALRTGRHQPTDRAPIMQRVSVEGVFRPGERGEMGGGGGFIPEDSGTVVPRRSLAAPDRGRFSAKASAPSIASAEPKTGPMISPCRANASALSQSADSTMTRLLAASASGAPWATRAASSLAPASASPGRDQPVDQARLGQPGGREVLAGQDDLHGQVVRDPRGAAAAARPRRPPVRAGPQAGRTWPPRWPPRGRRPGRSRNRPPARSPRPRR